MTHQTIIAAAELSSETLEEVIDELVTREGAASAEAESLSEKRRQIRLQVESGDFVIVFEPRDGTRILIRRAELDHESSAASVAAPRKRAAGESSGADLKLDSLILTYLIADDLSALEQLRAAGLSAQDIRMRAIAIGLSIESIKRIKLSGKRATIRACLKCNVTFTSSGSHNRLCTRCRG